MTGAEVDNLTLVGGALASIDLLRSTLGADALSSQANGTRAVDLGQIKLLDLGALLKGIGADLSALPLGTLSSLLSKLGIPVAGIATGGNLADTVTSLTSVVTGLQNTLVGATTSITNTVDNATKGLLGSLNLPVPAVGALVATVNTEITSVLKTVTDLLSNALAGLDSFPLLQISGTTAGITTKAADTLANSAAAVAALPLQITAAGVKLPVIDPAAIADTINGVIATANGALNGLLSTLGLPANLVSISVLQKATNVALNGKYTSATAGLSVLNVKIANLDPSVITGALSKLTGAGIGSLLSGTALSSVLGAANSMGAVNTLLGSVAPLLSGVNLQVASLAGASTYTFATAPPAPGTPPTTSTSLPHTGGTPELAIIGLILAAMAVGAVRWARVSRLQPAKVNSRTE
jgi:hypothetical protein